MAEASRDFYARAAPYYDFIYDALVDYPADVRYLEAVFKRFARRRPESILDVGCGTGTHAILLARRGYRVTGLDISRQQLAVARRKARAARLPVRFVRADMRSFDVGETFDAAICMFGGFGHLLRSRDVLSCLRSLRKHLRSGGLFVCEFWLVEGVKPTPYETWLHRRSRDLELVRLSESRFDRATRRLTIELHHLVLQDRRLVDRFSETSTIRTYTVDEMRALLRRGRFELLGAFAATPEAKGFRPVRTDTFRAMAVACSMETRRAQS